MRMLNMPSWGAQFFSLKERGGGRTFQFPNVFPSGSQSISQVLNLFPKMFPIPTQFYPIWFAQSSTPMYINWKGEHMCFYFATWGPKTWSFYWEVPNIPKKMVMG